MNRKVAPARAVFATIFFVVGSSLSLADNVILSPAGYAGSVETTVATSDYQTSQTGPIMTLSSESRAIINGHLMYEGEGADWPGPLTDAYSSVRLNSLLDNGYLQATTLASAPTQPVINDPGYDFSYNASAHSQATAQLTYDLYVTGPTASTQLLVKVYGYATGSAVGDNWLTNDVTATYNFGGIIDDSVSLYYGNGVTGDTPIKGTGNYYGSGDLSYGFVGGFTEDNVYTVQTGHLYQISLGATLSSIASTSTVGNKYSQVVLPGGEVEGYALIDPSYAIAPGTPNADDYTIYLSPQVSAGVPEPSTWTLMLIGMVGVMLVGRGRKSADHFLSLSGAARSVIRGRILHNAHWE
jgi:hypothetical protein